MRDVSVIEAGCGLVTDETRREEPVPPDASPGFRENFRNVRRRPCNQYIGRPGEPEPAARRIVPQYDPSEHP